MLIQHIDYPHFPFVQQFAMPTMLKVHEGYMYSRGQDAQRPKEAVCPWSPLSHS